MSLFKELWKQFWQIDGTAVKYAIALPLFILIGIAFIANAIIVKEDILQDIIIGVVLIAIPVVLFIFWDKVKNFML